MTMTDDQRDDEFDDLDDAPVVLRVVCTDRGQHSPARVATVTQEGWGLVTGDLHRRQGRERPVRDDDGEVEDFLDRSTYTPPVEKHLLGIAPGGASTSSHRFRCHRCCRHLTVADKRWKDMVGLLVKNGVPTVDISVLDRIGC